jgi:hypothetical protein
LNPANLIELRRTAVPVFLSLTYALS